MADGTMCEGCIFQLKGHNQGHIPTVQNDPLSWWCISNRKRVTLCNNSKFTYLTSFVNGRNLKFNSYELPIKCLEF